MKWLRILILFLYQTPFWVQAASEGIPVSFILFQLLNFGIFCVIVVFFIRRKAPSLLKRKHEDFLEMSQRSQKLFDQAQLENEKIKEKLKNIEIQMSQVESVIQDRVLALENQISQEGQKTCETILKGAQSLLSREHIKLRQSLLDELLDQIESSCKEDGAKTLRFLNKMQVRKAQ